MSNNIFITGASSGLGRALALHYASPNVCLGLAARRLDKLSQLKSEVEAQGATCYIYEVDVAENTQVINAAKDFSKKVNQVDLVIANAGIGVGLGRKHFKAEELIKVIDINVNGVIRTIQAFLPQMVNNKHGSIVTVSSVAAFRAMPPGTYSASKIAVKYYMDTLRQKYFKSGVNFTTLYPGFVKTEMTDKNSFTMPFIISAEKAASLMGKAIKRKKKNYIFPFAWKIIIPIMKRLPDFIYRMGPS